VPRVAGGSCASVGATVEPNPSAFTGMKEKMLKWMKEGRFSHAEHPVSFKNRVARAVWNRMRFGDFMMWVRKRI